MKTSLILELVMGVVSIEDPKISRRDWTMAHIITNDRETLFRARSIVRNKGLPSRLTAAPHDTQFESMPLFQTCDEGEDCEVCFSSSPR